MAKENIFLFYPNLIGYGRILSALLALYFMTTSPVLAAALYCFSAWLDAADGHAARMFNQSTRFGAMLDMLTDRCALLGLMMGLTVMYPQYAFLLQLSAIVDVASHWLFMVTSYICGKTSHKTVGLVDNAVIRLYYSSKAFLFFMCAGNELFYSAMYMMKFYPEFSLGGFSFWKLICIISFPVAFGKSLISLVHLIAASSMLGDLDLRERKENAAKKK